MDREEVGERGNDLEGSGTAKITGPTSESAGELMKMQILGRASDLPYQYPCGWGYQVG